MAETPELRKTGKTIILYSDELGKVVMAFNLAMGAVAMGFEVTFFCTYWGLNVLRNGKRVYRGKTFLSKVITAFSPSSPLDLIFQRQRCSSIFTCLIKRSMKKQGFPTLPELVSNAKECGVKFVACQSCLELFGISRDELMDGVEFGGIAKCLEAADNSNVSFFI